MAFSTTSAVFAGAIFALAAAVPAFAQQSDAPARSGDEAGNFGSVPFSSPQFVITRAEDRAAWRKLEDKQLVERREIEDKYGDELRALRARQATERDALLKTFGH
jgi:hypothetical protein